jgi:SCY1-like protein 2
MLNLIEAPIEDAKIIAYVSEPVEYNLAALQFDTQLRDQIPSEVDLKCQILELMECMNFLHANAKTIHLNLSPEHIYFTKEGRLKVAGLSFIQPFSTNEAVSVHFDYLMRLGDFAISPNLRFAAPELTDSQQVT